MFSKILENFLVCEGWGVCGVEFQNGKFGGGVRGTLRSPREGGGPRTTRDFGPSCLGRWSYRVITPVMSCPIASISRTRLEYTVRYSDPVPGRLASSRFSVSLWGTSAPGRSRT